MSRTKPWERTNGHLESVDDPHRKQPQSPVKSANPTPPPPLAPYQADLSDNLYTANHVPLQRPPPPPPLSSYMPYNTLGNYGYGLPGSTYTPYNASFNRHAFGSGFPTGMTPQGIGDNSSQFEASTLATFQLIESVVGAVGGLAQMLESTYMATHSSFFAMMSVAQQFGHLRGALESVLGIAALQRWIRRLLARLSGRRLHDSHEITSADFTKFTRSDTSSRRPTPSFKPLFMFVLAVVGLPYLIGRLVRSMARRQTSLPVSIDPSKLEFCKATYDFVPENPAYELELRRGDIVAVLAKKDPLGTLSQWWRVRARDGRVGYIPCPYVETIPQQVKPGPAAVQRPTVDRRSDMETEKDHT